MKESEHIKKFQREFELRQKIAESNAAKTQEIFTEIRKGLNAYINYGKENNRISKDYLTKYFDEIQNKIADLKDPKVICKFLLEEKGRCVAGGHRRASACHHPGNTGQAQRRGATRRHGDGRQCQWRE